MAVGRPFRCQNRLPLRAALPARLSAIKRALDDYGIALEKPTTGSHYKARGKSGVGTYPISAHNGLKTEISDVYVKGLCRHFDIDYDEFVQKL